MAFRSLFWRLALAGVVALDFTPLGVDTLTLPPLSLRVRTGISILVGMFVPIHVEFVLISCGTRRPYVLETDEVFGILL